MKTFDRIEASIGVRFSEGARSLFTDFVSLVTMGLIGYKVGYPYLNIRCTPTISTRSAFTASNRFGFHRIFATALHCRLSVSLASNHMQMQSRGLNFCAEAGGGGRHFNDDTRIA